MHLARRRRNGSRTCDSIELPQHCYYTVPEEAPVFMSATHDYSKQA